jgi:Ca2+-binding RTX toxin-like protein
MKISYSNWQQIDLAVFRPTLDKTISDGNIILNSLDDSTLYDNVTSYSNTSIKGNWSGYIYQIKGEHFTDSNPNVTITTLSFGNSNETFSASGRISSSDGGESISGYLSSISYANLSQNLTVNFSGKAYTDRFDGTETYVFAGGRYSLTGSFITNLEVGIGTSNIVSGTVTAYSFQDTSGHKISVSNVSIDYATFKSLTNTSSDISNLYTALNFSGNDTITTSATDDTLDGGAGVDTLIGGLGNDTYIIDLLSNGKLQDKITEAKNAGLDTLMLRGDIALSKAVTLKLVSNVENLDISLTNNSLLNLTGDNAANTLTGNAADNVIDGGKGIDTMIGGAGNDTYVLDNVGDIVTETLDAGTDLVSVKFTAGSYILGDNIENGFIAHAKTFTLTGNALDNSLTGGNGANTLNGAAGNDSLNGGKGNDILNGGAGNDHLTGGVGADTFVFTLTDIGTAGAPSLDTIADFTIKQKDVLDLRDVLASANETDLTGLLNFIDVTTAGANTEIRLSSTGAFTGGDYNANAEDAHITLTNVNLLAGSDESTLLQTLMTKNQLLID